MLSFFVTIYLAVTLSFGYATGQQTHELLLPPCESEIYCHGQFLHTVQMAKLYNDSKTFVDKKLRFQPEFILASFQQLLNVTDNQPTDEELRDFVDEHFDSEGSEFETWEPTDWVEEPEFLSRIANESFRVWGRQLHSAWKHLGRQIKDDVRLHPELYSLIYVAHPFIVPGGRFREFYYWDSYWIVRGLLISEMHSTVKGMLHNFLDMVDIYGMVPNGGRIYYERRSQPPLLIAMVDAYVTATDDVQFLRDHIHLLQKELQFWLENRTVEVKGHKLCRFSVEIDGPRPESYKEDYDDASRMEHVAQKQQFYINTKSGAESGWDFSSRWYIVGDEGHNQGDMGDINTRNIVPVDLNSFIYMNHVLLAKMFQMLGNEVEAEEYNAKAAVWSQAIDQVLWNPELGIWTDWDLLNQKPRNYFYPSNLAPLWAGCYNTSFQVESVTEQVLKYLETSRASAFIGGVPTSMLQTGQQWDFPNAWPPLQHMIVVGLEKTGQPKAQAVAFDLAQRWLLNNYVAYQQSGNAMFEKYDATVIGLPGGGGEYDVQLGFGWTNGVVIDFLDMYGHRLSHIHDDILDNDILDDIVITTE